MALKAFVKVCGVNNLSDARYCAGMGVNLLGFVMDENHSDYMPSEKFKEISEWLSGVDYVGEFGSADVREILKKVSENNLKYIQINSIDHIDTLTSSGLKIILKWPLEKLERLPYNLNVDYLMIHVDHVPSANEVESIRARTERLRVILDTTISADSVEDLLKNTAAHGIALTAGQEIRPGYKDYDELADILEVLEVED